MLDSQKYDHLDHLLPHHREHFRRKGLRPEMLAAAIVSSAATPEQALELVGPRRDGDAAPTPAIAYHHAGGTHVLRPDDRRCDAKGKLIKYEQRIDGSTGPFVPEAVCREIRTVQAPLYLTEGADKALVACQAGLATVAAPGIQQFHDVTARRTAQKAGGDDWIFPEAIRDLIPAGRTVVVVPDSDIDSNPGVMDGAARCIQMSLRQKAVVRISYLPATSEDAKVGMDDLYEELGFDDRRFRQAVEAAERPASPDEWLQWIRDEMDSWPASQRALELRRFLNMAVRLCAGDELVHIAQDVKKVFKLNKEGIEAAMAAAGASRFEIEADPNWHSPPGYAVSSKNGIQKLQGDLPPRTIAVAPMNVIEKLRDEAGRQFSTVRFEYDGPREHTVPRQELYGRELLHLAAYGAPVSQANMTEVQKFLSVQERHHLERMPEIALYTSFGWTEGCRAFVLGRRVIGGAGRVVAQADAKFLDAIEARGSRDLQISLWRQIRAESKLAELAIASAFAGPLLRVIGMRSVVLSLWGTSGAGKSALQSAAASAFGRPEGIKITGDISPAGFEGVLWRAKDTLAWVDDTQLTRNEGILESFAYMVGSGSSRTRATAEGGLRDRKDWLTLANVSGEHPLLRIGAAAGMKNRTVEVRVSPFKDATLARHIHQELEHHHGHPAEPFVVALHGIVARGEVDKLRNLYANVLATLDAQHDEQATLVSILVLADTLSRIYVFGEDETDARVAAVCAGKEVLGLARESNVTAVNKVHDVYDRLVAWVYENAEHFSGKRDPVYGALFEQDGKMIAAISANVFRKHALEWKFEVTQVMRELADEGKAVTGEKGRVTMKTQDLGEGRPRAYWIVMPDGTATAPGAASGPDAPPTNRRDLSLMGDVARANAVLAMLPARSGTGGTIGTK